MNFTEWLEKTGKTKLLSEKAVRSGTAHWAYPDGYMRSHYSSLYFTPTAADAVQKMGPKTDEEEVDHGQKTYAHHERMIKHERTPSTLKSATQVECHGLDFKEHLSIQQDYEVLMSLDEVDLVKLLASPSMFAAGAAGNILGQAVRGSGNIVGGGLDALGGLGSSAVGALQYLGGNKAAREKAKKRLKSGLGGIAGGAGKVLRGAAQIAATPVTAPIRGAQVVDDPGSLSGVFAPNDPDRNYWQDLFGLASGSERKEEQPKTKEVSKAESEQLEKVKSVRSAVINGSKVLHDAPDEWARLVESLRNALTAKEAIRIMSYMKKKFPEAYRGALDRARQLSRSRPSTNPSGLLRSGSRRPKPF